MGRHLGFTVEAAILSPHGKAAILGPPQGDRHLGKPHVEAAILNPLVEAAILKLMWRLLSLENDCYTVS